MRIRSELETTLTRELARLVLNRPAAGNRVTTELLGEIVSFLDDVASTRPVVLLVEGRGDDFCLGRDASGDTDLAQAEESLRLVVDIGRRLRELPALVLSAVQGRARGFGAGLAMHSDFAIATRGASLAFDEVERGFPPTIVMSYLEGYLPRKLARELICTGRQMSAVEARRLGVVNRVVENCDLGHESQRFASELLRQPRRGLSRCKPFLTETAAERLDRREDRAVAELVAFLAESRPEGEG